MIFQYLELNPGEPIEKYKELLCICFKPEVYISRRALKHFVESRSREMKLKSKEEVLYYLYFAVESAESVILNYDSLIKQNIETKYIYSKHFGSELKSSIRIVTEMIDSHQEVKSIHFQKNKKATE